MRSCAHACIDTSSVPLSATGLNAHGTKPISTVYVPAQILRSLSRWWICPISRLLGCQVELTKIATTKAEKNYMSNVWSGCCRWRKSSNCAQRIWLKQIASAELLRHSGRLMCYLLDCTWHHVRKTREQILPQDHHRLRSAPPPDTVPYPSRYTSYYCSIYVKALGKAIMPSLQWRNGPMNDSATKELRSDGIHKVMPTQA